jgi:hypothetical protein
MRERAVLPNVPLNNIHHYPEPGPGSMNFPVPTLVLVVELLSVNQ